MARFQPSKIQVLDARHPGLCQKVNAMFEAWAPLRAVAAMIQTQYGERISHTSIGTYRRRSWRSQRARIQEMKVVLTALQKLASEERN